MWRDPGTPVDSYYQVRPECTDVPKTRFKIKAGKTFKCKEMAGCIYSRRVSGYQQDSKSNPSWGVHPSIRGEVWEFLLGCYDPQSTFEEREQIQQR